MKAIHIREVPPDTLRALKRLARLHHRSLQGELHVILERAALQAPPEKRDDDLELVTVATGREGTWSRSEIYGDNGR